MTLVGLVATQYYLVQFVEETTGSFTLENLLAFDLGRFLADGFVNPAASFISVDAGVGLWGFVVFCIAESSRIKMKRGLLCLPVAILVAYAVAWPLFLLLRERHLHGQDAANHIRHLNGE